MNEYPPFEFHARIDWIARHLVTEAMVDKAIDAHPDHWGGGDRQRVRRNIAIGIHAGSYPLEGVQS